MDVQSYVYNHFFIYFFRYIYLYTDNKHVCMRICLDLFSKLKKKKNDIHEKLMHTVYYANGKACGIYTNISLYTSIYRCTQPYILMCMYISTYMHLYLLLKRNCFFARAEEHFFLQFHPWYERRPQKSNEKMLIFFKPDTTLLYASLSQSLIRIFRPARSPMQFYM